MGVYLFIYLLVFSLCLWLGLSRIWSSVIIYKKRCSRWVRDVYVLQLSLTEVEWNGNKKLYSHVTCTLILWCLCACRNWWASDYRLSWKSFKQATAADHPVLQNSLWKGKYIRKKKKEEEEITTIWLYQKEVSSVWKEGWRLLTGKIVHKSIAFLPALDLHAAFQMKYIKQFLC